DGRGRLQRLAQLPDRHARYHRDDAVPRWVDHRPDLLEQRRDLLRLHGKHDDVGLRYRRAVVRADAKADLGEIGQLLRVAPGDADPVGGAVAGLGPAHGERAAQVATPKD